MKIALVAHVRHPIAEPFMGGMEAHSFRLAEGLMKRGHDVTLFAAGDSDPRFAITPVIPEHYDRQYPWDRYRSDPVLYDYLDAAFAKICPRLFDGGHDVVHNNGLHRFVLQGAKDSGHPTVTSLHIPPFDALHGFVHQASAPNHLYSVVSEKQLSAWWPGGAPSTASVVYNGIDMEHWPFSAQSDDHALWCGRITRNKGPHFAIQAARLAGMKLRLFGYLEDRAYFDAEICPLLDDDIVYGGAIGTAHLAVELRRASLVVFTPCWDEPFGLVAIEAMSCGTPVASFDRGAVREVIGPDAGAYAPPDDPVGLAAAMIEARRISRHAARERVSTMFTMDQMLDRYEELYRRAIRKPRA